jgi:poly-gamma-glutamate capsule biosynthesis protein CapA/YwtB (metallophosphatase superfamily)
VEPDHMEFAHALIDEANVDIIHGHSSHHVKGIEVYKKKLILYGCGDFIDDYEGIEGYEWFRGDLGLMYFPSVDPKSGELRSMVMTPTQMKKLRVNRVTDRQDLSWFVYTLNREGKKFGTGVQLDANNRLKLLFPS